MARPIPDDRLSRLVEVATRVFIEQGFRQTRMDDVAEALGVAKGTLYLYVESKEALFDLVCRSADRAFEAPAELPLKSPPAGSTIRYIGERLAAGQVMPALAEALRNRQRDTSEEVAAIVGDIYDALARNRVGIKLVDRSARDIPELGQLWFGGARTFLVDALVHYLTDRVRTGRLRALVDAGVAARFVVETCTFWAVHRHWDVGRPDVPEDRIQAAVIDLVKAALVTPAAKSTDATRTKGRRKK
jgi:AcrR family transcriptional regulator